MPTGSEKSEKLLRAASRKSPSPLRKEQSVALGLLSFGRLYLEKVRSRVGSCLDFKDKSELCFLFFFFPVKCPDFKMLAMNSDVLKTLSKVCFTLRTGSGTETADNGHAASAGGSMWDPGTTVSTWSSDA